MGCVKRKYLHVPIFSQWLEDHWIEYHRNHWCKMPFVSRLRLLFEVIDYFFLSSPQTCSSQCRVVPHCLAWNGVLHQYDGPQAHFRPPRARASAKKYMLLILKRNFCFDIDLENNLMFRPVKWCSHFTHSRKHYQWCWGRCPFYKYTKMGKNKCIFANLEMKISTFCMKCWAKMAMKFNQTHYYLE